MSNKINRTTIQVEDNKYRMYAKAAPLFYKKSDGTYDDIDHTFNDTTSSIGDISLMDKGIVSVGKRKGNNPTKVVGIRPDGTQHLGTQQLEFSLVNVELDGQSQSFNVEDDLDIKLELTQVNQLVKVNKTFDDFKIEFDIHSTGLELQNNKYSETTTIRDYGFNLTNLGEIEGGNTNLTHANVYNNSTGSISAKNIPYLDVYISQITNEYIQTGEYSNTDEFGDSDLSSYTLESMYELGSSIYLKDCIVFNVKSYQIKDIETIVINNLCDLYGLSILDDGGNGRYFTKNNKKVGAYLIKNTDWTEFYVFFNTKSIPNKIKTLFQNKNFNDTSFLDITLSDFNTAITNRFNKNLKIELDSNYYEPINDRFEFKISKESFYINPPILFDVNKNILDIGTTHSLKDNGDGTYRYTKYFSAEGYLNSSNDIKYIDATISAGTNQINQIYYSFPGIGFSSSTVKTSGNFTTARNASSGNWSLARSGDILWPFIGDETSISTNQFGVASYSWKNYSGGQTYEFDSSGIDASADMSDLSLNIRGKATNTGTGNSHSDISIMMLKASDESLGNVSNDYNAMNGHTSGWDSDDVTEYSDEYVVTDTTAAWQQIDLNSTAIADFKSDSSVQINTVDYDQYYQNSFDSSYGAALGERTFDAYLVNSDTTSRRPYVEYTIASTGYGNDVLGLASANIGSVNGVATANIGKVNGV